MKNFVFFWALILVSIFGIACGSNDEDAQYFTPGPEKAQLSFTTSGVDAADLSVTIYNFDGDVLVGFQADQDFYLEQGSYILDLRDSQDRTPCVSDTDLGAPGCAMCEGGETNYEVSLHSPDTDVGFHTDNCTHNNWNVLYVMWVCSLEDGCNG